VCASLHELKRVKQVCGGAGHEGDDQPAPNFLHKLNKAKRVCGGSGHEGVDHPSQAFYMSEIGLKGCVVVQIMKGLTTLAKLST
jgi:hypothetical protein